MNVNKINEESIVHFQGNRIAPQYITSRNKHCNLKARCMHACMYVYAM